MYKSSKSKVNRHKEQRQTTKASNGSQAGISVRHFPLDPVAPSVAKKEGMTVCILFAYIVTVFPYTLDTFRIYTTTKEQNDSGAQMSAYISAMRWM